VVVIHLGACLAFFPDFFSVGAIFAAIGMHFLSGCLGISIGLHRILTHKSIAINKTLERLFVLFAIFEVHKPITWVARHRFHHKFAGTALDPHNANEGFFWSHMGWLLPDEPDGFEVSRFAPDVADDPFYRFLERYGFFVFLLSLILLYALGGFQFLIWAGFVRLVVVGHSVWAINSFCHLCHAFGYRNFPTADGYNLRLLSYFTYGEGLHNNHHGSQRNPNFAVRPDEIDLGWLVLKSLINLRLAKRTAI
jgi:stearoyl-CoA desaturase (delta-9 desaturase)